MAGRSHSHSNASGIINNSVNPLRNSHSANSGLSTLASATGTASTASGESRIVFALISPDDRPLFELSMPGGGSGKDDLMQFIVHAALDSVEQRMMQTNNAFLKQVDRFNEICVSAQVTAGNQRMLLLHDARLSEENIRMFFSEVHELYVKLLMNPFYAKNSLITSPEFAKRVKMAAERTLSSYGNR